MKLILVALFLVYLQNRQVDSSPRDVYEKIFERYRNELRPVHDESTQTVVKIQTQIWSLLEVNEAQEYIKASIFVAQQWKDEFLTWDPANFNGTTSVSVPASRIWTPDITLLTTSLQPEPFTLTVAQSASITYDGTVFTALPFVQTNYCKMDIVDYPFDIQECIIKMSPWSNSKEQLYLEHSNLSGHDSSAPMNNNTAWDILPYVTDSFEMSDGQGRTIRELWYRTKIKRKSTYYVWVLITPTFIITALSLAGLYTPFNNCGEREEKVTLGLTTLLTLAVILTMVTGDMPRGSSLPLLGRFVLTEIILIVLSMAVSVLIMFVHERATTRSWRVPSCLMTVFLCRPRTVNNPADQQQMFFEKATSSSWYLTASLNSESHSTSDEVILLRACLQNLNEINANTNGWLKEEGEKKLREYNWSLVLDRLELILFFLFQFVHLIVFVIMFYPYFDSFS